MRKFINPADPNYLNESKNKQVKYPNQAIQDPKYKKDNSKVNTVAYDDFIKNIHVTQALQQASILKTKENKK